MTRSLSLSAKILLLALVNLLLLVAAFGVLAKSYYGIEVKSLLFAPAHDRVVDVARQISLDLEHTSAREQTALMGRYAAVYGVDFYLFRNTGVQMAGRPVSLPAEVATELTRGPQNDGKGGRRPPPPPRRRPDFDGGEYDREGYDKGRREFDKGPFGHRPPPPDRLPPDRLPPDRPPPERLPQDEPPEGPPPEAREPRGRGGEPTIWNLNRAPVFQVTAGDLHWAGVRMPIPDPDSDAMLRGTLLISAKSFYGTPLFFDFKPWLGAMAAAIGIFVLCWLPFIRGLTRSISQLTSATERISQGDFELHLKDDRSDELGQLAGAINRMTGRLAGFVSGQKRFLGDIAHELCAPIARIQFGLGILEQRAPEEQLGKVADVQEEVRQMSALVGELLSFSKAGMEAARRPLTRVNVQGILNQAVEREATPESNVRIEADSALHAEADEAMLVRAVSNVVRNAIRYAGDAGPVTVSADRAGEMVRIVVADRGPGLEPEDLDKVFTPFYRPEVSRNRSNGGVGLGLAIVKSCVEACRGTVECRNRAGGGLEVEIRMRAA